ncbi:MAG: MobF family relaxase [Streptosporangiaceae bacterium]
MAVVVTAASGYDLGYVWRNQGQAAPERTVGGYYINAAQDGEPPGRWWGPGAEALGFASGQIVERHPYEQVYQQVHPQTGQKLGRSRGNYAKFEEHFDRLKAAEPHATTERLLELEREAAQATRQAAAYTDLTVSFSKSISILHASIRENARRARLAGDEPAAAWWDGEVLAFEEILQQANLAGLEYVQQWAGMTRTGYHGARVDGREPGRFEQADLVVTSWLQGTSRDGDPQDHIHNQIARIVRTRSDGKWRALDTASLRVFLGSVQAIVAAHVECALTRRYCVGWVARPDGNGLEIEGITQAQMDAYSTRTVTIREELPEAVASWIAKYGRTPSRRELLFIQNEVTMSSRKGKREGEIDWDVLCAQWDATLGGALASVAPAVSNLRSPDAGLPARNPDPSGPPSRDAQVRLIQTALAQVQAKRSAWTRSDLLKQLGLAHPPEMCHMDPAAAEALLQSLADEALAGDVEQVICLDAPEWPPLPEYLRRELDGRSAYTRPGTTHYATRVQLSMEEQLVAQAQRLGAPVLSREEAARLLGADPDALDAHLRARAQDAQTQTALEESGLRMDQAAALFHALTSPRVAEVIVGPAGSGKTRVLAAGARAWIEAGKGQVLGTATSQAARNVLAASGVQMAENASVVLGHLPGRRQALGIKAIMPGTLIVVDEASMMPMADLVALVDYAARHGCKVVIAGDQEQLAAVEGGGGMMLLAHRLGYVQLAEPVRFEAQWERDASLRLRAGDVSVLDEYYEHGRIRGGSPEQVTDDACRAYLAHYLAGRDVLLMIAERARCREVSRRIRDDLVHLGLVQDGLTIRISHGARASVGDLIICRENDRSVVAGEPGRTLANGDVLRIEAIGDGTITVRRAIDCDPETGRRRFTDHAFTYGSYGKCDLAYAVTGHSAQGRTIRTGIAIVTGLEDRQWLYVAMTRGTESNTVHAFTMSPKTADPEPGTRPAPELERYDRVQLERSGQPPRPVNPDRRGQPDPRAPLGVLADVVERDGAADSAMETLRRNLSNADHLAILNAQWQGETQELQRDRYRAMVLAALPPDYRHLSHQATWLWRTLRAAEAAGLDVREVIREAVVSRSLAGARDVAAVLDARIRDRVSPLVPLARQPWTQPVRCIADAERQQYVAELARAMEARKERIGAHAAESAPEWAVRALGSVPEDPLDRLEWERRASDIGAYRELYFYDHPTEPIGPEPSGDSPEKRAAWHAAFAALGPIDGVDLRSEPDGRLLHIRDTYAAETAWAPTHVGRQLRQVRIGADDASLAATRADAEAQAAHARDDREVADRHTRLAASYRAMEAFYRQHESELAATMEGRREWELATEQTRHLAVAADSEYRRRHPEQRLGPLRSAEPVVPEGERELTVPVLSEQYQTPEWISKLAEERRIFRERIDERGSVRVPAEDPDYQDEGEAWPTWIPRDREAILQPPKPQMRPAQQVAERAQEREASS